SPPARWATEAASSGWRHQPSAVRRRDYVPLVLLGGIAAFIVVQGKEMGRDRASRRPRKTDTATAAVAPQGTPDSARSTSAVASRAVDIMPAVELRPSGEPSPTRDDAAVR